MKILITAVVVVLVLSSASFSQPYVVIDTITGNLPCGQPVPEREFIVVISIANPVDDICVFVIGFQVTSRQGGTVAMPDIEYYNGIDTIFEFSSGIYNSNIVSITGTCGINFLPISSDTIPYFGLKFQLDSTMELDTLCIDSMPTAGFDNWIIENSTNIRWSGDTYIEIGPSVPTTTSVINNCSVGFAHTTYCLPFALDFNAQADDPGIYSYRFIKLDGPGSVDSVTGIWTFEPDVSDIFTTFPLILTTIDDVCGSGEHTQLSSFICSTNVFVGYYTPPVYVVPQPYRYVAITDEELSIQLEIDNPYSFTEHSFDWYTSWQDPDPPGATIDNSTGIFRYTGQTSDTGLYWVYNVISLGNCSDTMGFFIYHFEDYTCGDLNHDGTPGHILDLTWLVDFIFRGGPTPAPNEAGNMDCEAGVNILDLVYIVDFIFRGGDSPCSGCP